MDEVVMLHGLKEAAISIKDLEKRLNEVEETLSVIMQDNMLSGRVPYECPNCKGNGDDGEGFYCISCDGKGIVWG